MNIQCFLGDGRCFPEKRNNPKGNKLFPIVETRTQGDEMILVLGKEASATSIRLYLTREEAEVIAAALHHGSVKSEMR